MMIIARMIPMITMMLGMAGIGIVVAMLLAGMLGYRYFAFPASHVPVPAPVRILPVPAPIPAAEPMPRNEDMVQVDAPAQIGA